MYRKLLVPLDGSTFGETALPVALDLAGKAGGIVELATVREPLTAMVYQEWMSSESGWEERYLDEVADRLGRTSEVQLTTAVLAGGIAEALVEHATRIGADGLVMATHGRGPFSRTWLGSVADGVVRKATIPILLVRPEEPEEGRDVDEIDFSRILVPLDGSQLAEEALEPAMSLGRLYGASYTLVRVVHFPTGLSSPYIPDAATLNRQVVDEAKARAESYLETVAGRLRADGAEVQTRVAVEPQPGIGIVRLAREGGFGLLAMATHGRGGVSRALLGSVADKVIRSSHTPILVVRPPEERTT